MNQIISTSPSPGQAQTFQFGQFSLRALLLDGEPWFVAADVARALGYRDAYNLARRLDEDEKGTHSVSTLGGQQDMSVISESGLYSAILTSQVEGAKEFKRWVTTEVLPAIRKTGTYQAPQTLEERSLSIITELTGVVAEQKALIAEIEPKAQAFEDFLGAEGSCSVGDAAKILCKAGINTGPQRLFRTLDSLGWTYIRAGERHIKQDALERGYLVAKAQSYYDQNAGVRKVTTPQVRVTAKGLNRLREKLLPPIEDLAQLTA